MTEEPKSSPTIESTDAANKDNAVDTNQEEEREKNHRLSVQNMVIV